LAKQKKVTRLPGRNPGAVFQAKAVLHQGFDKAQPCVYS
jgi:hypothetical protein